MRTVVLLNRKAGSGEAGNQWQTIASKLANLLGARPSVYDETRDWKKPIQEASSAGACLVTAVGGDGTVHRVANLVLALPPDRRGRTLLGAVGLGSSNDFHKPTGEHSRFLGVPVRCWPRRTTYQDVLEIGSVDASGVRRTEYAVTSASLGVVALGNDLFNRRWGPVGVCRSLGEGLGIWSAALGAVCQQKGIPVDLSVDGQPAYAGTTCFVGFYVNRHIAGSLTYAEEAGVGSARMGVLVLPDVGLLRRVYLLGRAARSALASSPQALVRQAVTSRCRAGQPALLEMDGEVTRVREMHVRFVPRALRVCA